MSNQFSVIITENIKDTRIQIKHKHDQIQQKSNTYLKTDNQSILLLPPEMSVVREYQADIVVNETQYTNLSKVAAKPDGVIVNTKTENYTVEE